LIDDENAEELFLSYESSSSSSPPPPPPPPPPSQTGPFDGDVQRTVVFLLSQNKSPQYILIVLMLL